MTDTSVSKHSLYQREYTRRNRDKINTQRKENYYRNRDYILQRERNRYHKDVDKSRAKRRGHYHKSRIQWCSLGHDVNFSRWKEAEEIAVSILERLGYHDILYVGGHGIFDIVASKDSMEYVFDVTCKVHTYKKLQCQLAKRWLLIHRAIFITLEHKKFIIKDFNDKGYAAVRLRDMDNACSYV